MTTEITRPSMRHHAERVKPLLVSRKVACALLDCSTDTVDKLIAQGLLQAVKLGPKRVGIKMSSIDRIADKGVDA